jgi:hypothetical protein
MRTIRIMIDRDNDAFDCGNESSETSRILRALADSIDKGTANLHGGQSLRCTNMDVVGFAWEVE